jgi:hypothetical protein
MKELLVVAALSATHLDDRSDMMMNLAMVGAYSKICHRELSPAARRGWGYAAAALGIDHDEFRKLSLMSHTTVWHYKEQPALVAGFCDGIERALIPLENLGRGPIP